MIVVAGPRIDPASLPVSAGLEVRGYVHELYRHLAACDLAVVQGGLTTAMELDGAPAAVPLRSRCAATSSRTSTSATASTATARAIGSTSATHPRRDWPTPSPAWSGPSPPTARSTAGEQSAPQA